MARSQATLIFAAALVVNVLLLSQSGLTNIAVQQHDFQDFRTETSSFRRRLFATGSEGSGENVRPYSPIRFPRIPSFVESSDCSHPPGFAWGAEPIYIISVDPLSCPSRINAHMSRRSVQSPIPSSRFIISSDTSAQNHKLDHGPSQALPLGSDSSSLQSA